MLEPCQYPSNHPELPKLKALENQAKLLGDEYHKNFSRVPNDCTGINDGSKNSTIMNYIPDAWNHGCEIFCECNVQRIKKCKKTKKYIIFYEWLDVSLIIRIFFFLSTCNVD